MATATPCEGHTIAVNYWEERVRMAQWWSDYLDQLRLGGNVVDIQRSVAA